MNKALKRYPLVMWNTNNGIFPAKELSMLPYLVDELLIKES